jgi:nitroimidazol reductase NimA-like FMN-containing flavoprotein (pyridoxamine 5'-phosphate oxidase superfamily)
METYPTDAKNRIKRLPERGHYDLETIYQIIDEALICQVAFIIDDQPYNIPTLHARRGNELLLHGATSSRLIRHIEQGHPLSIAMTLVDGLVLAKAVFHHSINYRSVVLFGTGRVLVTDGEKIAALEHFTEKILPGRWQDARPPNAKELKATAVAVIDIENASAKVRSGPPKDDPEDAWMPVWSGVLPLETRLQTPQPVIDSSAATSMPAYLAEFIKRNQ